MPSGPVVVSRSRWSVAWVVAALALLIGAGSASAAVPNVDIGANPLPNVSVGNDLSCQVKHTGDTALEFYPSGSTPGDCGTFIAGGGSVYGPNFDAHDGTATSSVTGSSYIPFTPVGQSGKTGAGTTANPFKVVTQVTAGQLGVSQTDSYVTGQESYRTDVTITNNGGGPITVTVYRAGDCFLQNSDSGFGFVGGNGAVGCSENANNSPAGRIEEWVPITPGNNFLEDGYSEVWQAIAKQAAFPDQCVHCTDKIDNGAGISWTVTINPGQSVTLSHFTTFSPTGRAGPPSNQSTDVTTARTPKCFSIPSVVRNRLGKVPGVGTAILKTRQVDNPAKPLKLSVGASGKVPIASVTFLVNGKILAIGRATSINVSATALKVGTSRSKNKVVAVVVFTNGRSVKLTQFMIILRCHVPKTTCKRTGKAQKSMFCSSRTPLSGRRARVTVTRSATETARGGPAKVTKGRYSITVRSANSLGPGVYAYKAVITTNRRGVRFQMIRLVTVK
jgi:hypothetical protein